MDFAKFINALHTELETKTQQQLAEKLGISSAELSKWKKTPPSERVIAKALIKASNQAVKTAKHHMVKSIVEFFPIERTESRQGAKEELFPWRRPNASEFQVGLKTALNEANGIYIFYDSRGCALYAGKAVRQSLWDEMNKAYNRDRKLQNIVKGKNQLIKDFIPSHEIPNGLMRVQLRLSELATYFSAYQVDDDMTDEIEALLIRGFANDLWNVRLETMGRARRNGG